MSAVRKDAGRSEISRVWQWEGSTAGQQRTRPRAPTGHSCQHPSPHPPNSTDPVCVLSWEAHRSPQREGNREAVFVFFFSPLSVNTDDFNFTKCSDCTDDKVVRVHQWWTMDVLALRTRLNKHTHIHRHLSAHTDTHTCICKHAKKVFSLSHSLHKEERWIKPCRRNELVHQKLRRF